jgi:uncharacterized protein
LLLELANPAVQHRRMKCLISLAVVVVALSSPVVRADDVSHRAAAESLLNLMDMQQIMTQSIDSMLDAQVKQNPMIAPYQQIMKTFFTKYMSWDSMKADMVKLYAAEFTEPELKELAAFYQTPIGKKTIQKMPLLLAKGAELGQRRVQEHLPELQAAIAAQAGANAKPSP